jgi:simple sugar transport system substrate-binding protein
MLHACIFIPQYSGEENTMNTNSVLKRFLTAITAVCIIFISAACSKSAKADSSSIAVFIPGIMADSPTYAKVAKGVTEAVDAWNTKNQTSGKQQAAVTIIEAGTNQAEWSTKITALAAAGTYDVIISSNPSLPEICDPITAQFPSQKFILLDAFDDKNKNIASVSYDQRTQSFLSGYISGLMSKTHKLGLIAAQEYPIMNTVLLPYYKMGAEAANKNCTVDFRVVGNWYDASKGAELARAMASTGVDVILPICGGASQGVISTAKELGMYIAWFDENGFDRAPGTIISCTQIKQDEVAKEMTTQFLEGKTPFGTARVVGTIQDGYMEFITDNPHYTETVPANVQNLMNIMISQLTGGSLVIPEKAN